MLSATRRWFRRNRTPIAVGVGIVGAGYLATKYLLNKLNDARERMSSERIAKENLRRRFEQNQEDCTFTVLALLPTATTNILDALKTERITWEIQQLRKGAGAKVPRGPESTATPPSIADTSLTEEEASTSLASLQSESGIHASQLLTPSASRAAEPSQDAGQAAPAAQNGPGKSKRQLWDDLTISSITRAYTLIYLLALLTMLTRVQLNLLGRRSYLSSVVSLASGTAQQGISLENDDDDDGQQAYGNDFDTNRRYLTFSWWLLNRAWIHLMRRVEEAVREVFGHLSPRDLLSFDTFSQLTFEVRKKVQRSTEGVGKGGIWLPLLLPPSDMEDFVLRESGVLAESATAVARSDANPTPSSTPASLRRLLDETADLIESPAFSHVFTLLVDAGFNVLLSRKLGANIYGLSTLMPQLEDEQSTNVVLLPKILSVLTREAHLIGNGMPNEYLQEMEQVRDLEAFAAVVYSSNWENEILEDGTAAYTAGKAKDKAPQPSERLSSSRLSDLGGESAVIVGDVGPSQTSFESAWQQAVERR